MHIHTKIDAFTLIKFNLTDVYKIKEKGLNEEKYNSKKMTYRIWDIKVLFVGKAQRGMIA